MFVRYDVCLQAEGIHFQRLLSIEQVRTEYLLQYVELKRVDPDSQQTGIAANAALPAFMRNILVEE
jgi:hypothetical protein